MFTGIVQEIGSVAAVDHGGEGSRLVLRLPTVGPDLRLGDSVAIDGCCLTVVEREGDAVTVEAMGETLARTTVGALRAGDAVNAEPAVRAGEPLGGHIVQG